MAEIRRCPLCRTDSGHMIEDTPKQRLYECRECFAVEVITKGKSSWWYHGWEHPDGRRVDGNGKKEQRPAHMAFGWWDASRSKAEGK